jgi:UDP-N-acetylglucosamine 2-epimerase (non-hydrolysing)
MEEGAVMMIGLEVDRVIQALSILNTQKRGKERTLDIVKDYNVQNVSDKIIRILIVILTMLIVTFGNVTINYYKV